MSDIYRDSIFWVEVERIKPNPFQPRREFDKEKLEGLAESIRMYGLLQPLTVTRNEKSKEDGGIVVEYELVAGERRLRASKIAGLTQIPVIIRSGEDTDQMKLELAIIENLQREDLNPVDRAKAFHRLHKDFRFTHSDIGKKVGKSREYVTNTLRLLALPEEIQRHLADGRIVEGHTRPLLMLNDKPEEQMVLVKEIMLKSLTVRESETLARRAAQDKVSPKYKVNPEILNLERQLTEKLGTRVQIEQREKGGKVVISFFSPEDLNTLLDTMRFQGEKEGIRKAFEESVEQEASGQEEGAEPVQDPVNEPVATQDAVLEQAVEEMQQEAVSRASQVEEKAQTQISESIEEVLVEAEVASAPSMTPETSATQEINSEAVTKEQDTAGEQQEGGQSMADRFKEFLIGHSLIQEDQVPQDNEPDAVTGAVEPSPARPMPEPKPAEEVKNDTETEPVQEPESEQTAEDDLYSIRNFSI